MINVLGLCSYPIESAATRYRLAQFVEPLKEKGVNLEISPFLDSVGFKLLYDDTNILLKASKIGSLTVKRFLQTRNVTKFDFLFIQREAMFFGPAFFEWLFQKVGNIPMVLDLDDATYVRYISPTYGRLGSFFKFFGKTDKLIKRAEVVTCGNRFIAEYIEKKGSRAKVIPTVVDPAIFYPVERNDRIPVIGWIGTHSTFPLLESIFDTLQELAKKHEFVLSIVGAGSANIQLEGVEVRNAPWKLETEVQDFQSLDIGLYPIQVAKNAPREWILGKSGFKAVQYLALGIPFVMTPIGICAEIGESDVTHFSASSSQEWYQALDVLLSNADLRTKMGESGRRHALAKYSLAGKVEDLADVFLSSK